MNVLRAVSSYSIISGLLILPLIFLRTTVDPVTAPRLALLGMLVLIASVVIFILTFKSSRLLPWNPLRCGIAMAMLGYLILQAVSLTQAINVQEGLFTFIKALLGVLFFLLVVISLINNSMSRTALTKAFSLVGFLLATIGLCQYFDIWFTEIPGNIIPYGTMANKNLLASAVFFTMFLTLYGCCRLKGAWRYFAILALGSELLLLALCKTRAVYLGFGGAIFTALIAIGFVIQTKHLRKASLMLGHRRMLRVIAILSLLFVTLLSVVAIHDLNQESVADRILIKSDDHNLNVRLDLWSKSFEMFADSPVIGVGVGNWKIMIPKYGITGRSLSFVNTYFQRPHNDFIWVLTETGPLGLALYLAVFVIGAVYCVKVMRSKGNDLLFSILMLGYLVGYLAIAFFSYPMERITHTVFLMTTLALVVTMHHAQFPQKSDGVPVAWIRVGSICAILIVGFSLILSYHRLSAETHMKRAVAAASVEAWEESIIHVDRAQSPFVNLDPTTTPFACYRGIANSSLGLQENALSDYLEAIQANPFHLQVLNNLATVYEQRGDHLAALEYYKTALQVSPSLDQTLVNLAAVYYNMGDYETAYEYLTQKRSGPRDPRHEQFLDLVVERLDNEVD